MRMNRIQWIKHCPDAPRIHNSKTCIHLNPPVSGSLIFHNIICNGKYYMSLIVSTIILFLHSAVLRLTASESFKDKQ